MSLVTTLDLNVLKINMRDRNEMNGALGHDSAL